MKEITLFLLNNCPHCRLALRLQEELLEEHPAWRDIPLRMVDEAAEPAYADTFDYYYVPCYYVDGVKVHEGHAERADVEAVFRAAAVGLQAALRDQLDGVIVLCLKGLLSLDGNNHVVLHGCSFLVPRSNCKLHIIIPNGASDVKGFPLNIG